MTVRRQVSFPRHFGGSRNDGIQANCRWTAVAMKTKKHYNGGMMRKALCTLLFVLCLGTSSCTWSVEDERLSKANQVIVQSKRQKIEAEIATLKDHPWAGEYYFGDGRGANASLTLAPKNGFTVTWHGCLGLYDQNYGTVDWDGDTIRLSFTFEIQRGYIGRYASEYRPIRWGERVYLIPSNEIIAFCNAINSRNEPRDWVHGDFFLRWGDEKKEAKGKPELPEEFMPYLLDKPVDATIVSVESIREGSARSIIESDPDRGEKIATVIINKGRKDGLLPGMELYVIRPDNIYRTVKLLKVEETQSVGEFSYDFPWEHGDSFRTPTPEAGWQLSTHPSWRRNADEPSTSEPATVILLRFSR